MKYLPIFILLKKEKIMLNIKTLKIKKETSLLKKLKKILENYYNNLPYREKNKNKIQSKFKFWK